MELLRARGQSRVEGTEIGTEDLGAAQDGIEILPDYGLPPCPFPQTAVTPYHGVVDIKQDDPVGHLLQDTLVLQQFAELKRFAQMGRGDINGVELLPSQPRKGAYRVLHRHGFNRVAEPGKQGVRILASIPQ